MKFNERNAILLILDSLDEIDEFLLKKNQDLLKVVKAVDRIRHLTISLEKFLSKK